jgi:hypothetical protein
MFSAVHPTTDIVNIFRHVRFVPGTDSCTAGKQSYREKQLPASIDFSPAQRVGGLLFFATIEDVQAHALAAEES